MGLFVCGRHQHAPPGLACNIRVEFSVFVETRLFIPLHPFRFVDFAISRMSPALDFGVLPNRVHPKDVHTSAFSGILHLRSFVELICRSLPPRLIWIQARQFSCRNSQKNKLHLCSFPSRSCALRSAFSCSMAVGRPRVTKGLCQQVVKHYCYVLTTRHPSELSWPASFW